MGRSLMSYWKPLVEGYSKRTPLRLPAELNGVAVLCACECEKRRRGVDHYGHLCTENHTKNKCALNENYIQQQQNRSYQ